MSFLVGTGSIPPQNGDTNIPIIYQQRYQQIGRIPTETSKRSRTLKSDLCLILLIKMNVGE
jgi:hypothetical protein